MIMMHTHISKSLYKWILKGTKSMFIYHHDHDSRTHFKKSLSMDGERVHCWWCTTMKMSFCALCSESMFVFNCSYDACSYFKESLSKGCTVKIIFVNILLRGRKGKAQDVKIKLERSRQSARECRARKKLRYQYVDDIIAAREQANDKLREELVRLVDMCHELDKGRVPDGFEEMLRQESLSQAGQAN